MRIYLLRHGEAVTKDDPSIASDADRPLTFEGLKRTRQAAEGLKALEISFDAVFTSPWLRAQQTAEIACDALGLREKLMDMEELAGDRSIEEVMNALVRYTSLSNIMLVGHNPLLPHLAAYLLSLSTSMEVDLKKSGICAIEVARIPPKNPGTLLWMMSPRHLRALRG